MNFPTRETNRLHLVQITSEHVDGYFDIMSRPDVTKYYGMDPLHEQKQAFKMIESFQTTYENHRGIRWGMLEKGTNRFIGTIGLNNWSTWSKRAEIGYELHPVFWRKGYATEAIQNILEYSFLELDLFRMGAVTFPENEASNKLLRKIGFKQEGVLRGYLFQTNQSHDAFVFSILRPEWEKTSS
ncbi:GNAT family N-acetyltransferase [Radiobacillus kanasensis]|uniref:GNAT family N-acetyltransferase n=1 Tax=Radiobacillus kanasensis TaxID=2844358 RepID=UPI001E63ECAD|nr:GNAT family N-acetyltransferase [Radiobacillus kanasensis]UFU00730.1 GNAT family N-acetyltransferase [Radiobacillus kanasensis]